MDISLDVENYRLNIRAAGVIVHNDKLLVHRNINKNHYAIPGGRVAIGENSAQTVQREMEEELGKKVEITGYIATIENFFEMNGANYHEIMFVHKVEFIDEIDKTIEETIHNVEGKPYLQYEWLPLDSIEEYPIMPYCIKDILKGKQFPVHKIQSDIGRKK